MNNLYQNLVVSKPPTINTVRITGFSPAWRGAWLKVSSYVCFALINCIIRYWSAGSLVPIIHPLSIYELLFFQNLFATIVLLPWLYHYGWKGIITPYPRLNLLRIITAITGLGLWYLTICCMPIAEGVAITFTGPIFALIGARIFLQEKMSFQRVIAVTLSLTGAYIIVRPHNTFLNSDSTIGLAALLPLGSAIALAVDKLYTRKLTKLGVKPETLVISFLTIMLPFSAILAYFSWVMPSTEHWKWLVILGLLTAGMHYCFVKAYMLAEVSFLTPIGFTKFFLSAATAYYVFSELPKHWTFWLGSFIIFISILLLIELPSKFRNSLFQIKTTEE